MGTVLGGIDIGTLTCRLLIGQVAEGGHLTELYGDRRILRLGEGLDGHGTLQGSAMDRVLGTLRDWRTVIEGYKPKAVSVVATSAVRAASNRLDFLRRVQIETAFEVEVLTGEEEARLTLLGIRSGLSSDISDILGLDIGGGSTEFILDSPGAHPIIQSIELGVVRLAERLLRSDPPTGLELQKAKDLIQAQIAETRQALGELHGFTLVGTAGTITTLAAMDLRLPTYRRACLHNYRLRREAIEALEQALLVRTRTQRRDLPGLEPGREDLIIGGTLILLGVMGSFGFTECLVSDRGLREGLLVRLADHLPRAAPSDSSPFADD